MNAAVIVAAGRGTRMGLERNKVLAPLCGEPVIARTGRRAYAAGWRRRTPRRNTSRFTTARARW